MKTTLTAFALAAMLAEPASATTFPTLTTIYIGSGVRDDGSGTEAGTATTFHCTNVSGVTTSVRFLVLGSLGAALASTIQAIGHGETRTVSTHFTRAYGENASLATGLLNEGAVNIESLQSAVFCNAKTIDAAAAPPIGVTLPLVRVNPHPGTVE